MCYQSAQKEVHTVQIKCDIDVRGGAIVAAVADAVYAFLCAAVGSGRTSENCSINAAEYLSVSTPSSLLRSSTIWECGVADEGAKTYSHRNVLLHCQRSNATRNKVLIPHRLRQ